jgi:hypothetical protein
MTRPRLQLVQDRLKAQSDGVSAAGQIGPCGVFLEIKEDPAFFNDATCDGNPSVKEHEPEPIQVEEWLPAFHAERDLRTT